VVLVIEQGLDKV